MSFKKASKHIWKLFCLNLENVNTCLGPTSTKTLAQHSRSPAPSSSPQRLSLSLCIYGKWDPPNHLSPPVGPHLHPPPHDLVHRPSSPPVTNDVYSRQEHHLQCRYGSLDALCTSVLRFEMNGYDSLQTGINRVNTLAQLALSHPIDACHVACQTPYLSLISEIIVDFFNPCLAKIL